MVGSTFDIRNFVAPQEKGKAC